MIAINRREIFSFYSHLVGAIGAFIGSIFLLNLTGGNFPDVAVAFIYSFSICWLFIASSIYHANKKEENSNSIWRKFDHLAIFFMIAGTYTPLCYYYLDGVMKWGIIIAQWSIVLLGVFFKIFFLNVKRRIYTYIYLMMGWMVVIPMNNLLKVMPIYIFILIAAGGLLYTAGAIIYARKKPDPLPGIFGFHEIFHVLIIAAAILHFISIYQCIKLNVID